MQGILQDPKELHRMRHAFANAGPGPGTMGDWARLTPDARALRSAEGRNIWRAAKQANRLLGVAVVIAAISSTSALADIAESYGRNLQRGDTAMADLDAVDLSIQIMNATGNYYMGYIALDVLLTD